VHLKDTTDTQHDDSRNGNGKAVLCGLCAFDESTLTYTFFVQGMGHTPLAARGLPLRTSPSSAARSASVHRALYFFMAYVPPVILDLLG